MDELLARIEEKLLNQIQHTFGCYQSDEIKKQAFILGFEWYLKGLESGIQLERNKVVEEK